MDTDRDPGTTKWSALARVGAASVVVALVVATVAVVATQSSDDRNEGVRVEVSAKQRVLEALDATLASGSFAVTYSMSATPRGVPISGRGVTNVDPLAVLTVSDVGGLGTITTRFDAENVWQYGGADYGLTPGSEDGGPGAPISEYAPLVLGTLGPQQGPVAMLRLASHTGYLELVEEQVKTATEAGRGTVDGVPVTLYDVVVDARKLLDLPNISREQAAATREAVTVLEREGLSAHTAQVAIDDDGFIRRVTSTVRFGDGGSVTNETVLSQFGCAGAVGLPGRRAPSLPPPSCPRGQQ